MGFLKNAFYCGKDFFEDTAENIRETVSGAIDSAKLQYRITAKRNEINALYAYIGKAYCTREEDEETLDKIHTRIKAKEEILDGLEKQLRIVAGKVICPDCGKFMSDKYVYCPYCGKSSSDRLFDDCEADISEEELDEIREIDQI